MFGVWDCRPLQTLVLLLVPWVPARDFAATGSGTLFLESSPETSSGPNTPPSRSCSVFGLNLLVISWEAVSNRPPTGQPRLLPATLVCLIIRIRFAQVLRHE